VTVQGSFFENHHPTTLTESGHLNDFSEFRFDLTPISNVRDADPMMQIPPESSFTFGGAPSTELDLN